MRVCRWLGQVGVVVGLVAAPLVAVAGELTVSPAVWLPHVEGQGVDELAFRFVVTNGPGVSNTVSSVTLTGPHCDEFAITLPGTFPQTLEAGTSREWYGRFDPRTPFPPAFHPCTLVFADEDSNEDSITVEGIVSAPAHAVASVSSLDFGQLELGAKKSLTFWITNEPPIEPAPVQRSLVYAAGSGSTEYSAFCVGFEPPPFMSAPVCEIASGQSREIRVTFAPKTAVGIRTGSLKLGDATVALLGSAVTPAPLVNPPPVPATGALGPALLALFLAFRGARASSTRTSTGPRS
jgi:hypothetical protein